MKFNTSILYEEISKCIELNPFLNLFQNLHENGYDLQKDVFLACTHGHFQDSTGHNGFDKVTLKGLSQIYTE